MPRPPLITRPRALTINLPEDIAARLELHLMSPTLGRVPHGAYKDFFVERINEYFARTPTDPTKEP